MKKEGTFALRIYPVLFMMVLTIIFISAVSGIHLATRERVKLNETLSRKKAVLYASGIDYPEGDIMAIQEIYADRVREEGLLDGEPSWFRLLKDGNTAGYAVYVNGAGLWGKIVSVFSFEKDLRTIRGVEFVEQNETPGLGARITESWFKEQFRGKKAPFTLVEEGTADEADELDAITGATRTSAAVLKIANSAPGIAEELVEE